MGRISNEIGMSPSGKAPDFDSGIRRFESCHPSQISKYGSLAQLVEQRPFKAWVQGSSPWRATKKADTHLGICFFVCLRQGLEESNAARMSAAREGLTERHNNVTSPWRATTEAIGSPLLFL